MRPSLCSLGSALWTGFAARVAIYTDGDRHFIHTWLQPGVMARKLAGNRLNGFPLNSAFDHLAEARCDLEKEKPLLQQSTLDNQAPKARYLVAVAVRPRNAKKQIGAPKVRHSFIGETQCRPFGPHGM